MFFSMKHRWPTAALCVCLVIMPQAAGAAARKPARKSVAKVVKTPTIPAVAPEAVVPSGGFMVPKVVTLRPATAAETQANAIWSLRAALNVAALQCQFSKYLETVKNYNDFLKQHADELVQAQSIMLGHFRRYDKARATNSFDQYTTRTYNSYSTLDAQYAFCDSAGLVGREILTIPKNGLGREAIRRTAEIRASLERRPLLPSLALVQMTPLPLPAIVTSDQ